MFKKAFLILISILLILFFISPEIVFAQENQNVNWPLKQGEVENLLDIIRKEPLTDANFNLFFESLSHTYSDYPRKTGAVVLVKQAILKEQLDYWFKGIPKELSKKFLKTALEIGITIITKGSYGAYDILNQLEKITVKKANEYALNWFLQNEIKIGSGETSYIFPSYKGNTQKLDIQYIIVYKPLSQNKREIVAEFYSKNPIEPPIGTRPNAIGGNRDDPRSTPWPSDRWIENERQRDNDGKLEPFIVRVKGFVERNDWNQFIWDKSKPKPVVEIDFDKPVPEIENSDIILESPPSKISFAKEISKLLLEKLKSGVGEIKDTTANLINKIKSYLTSIEPAAQIESHDLPKDLLSKLEDLWRLNLDRLTEEALSLEKIKEALEEEGKEFPEKIKLTLDELIERFDDISEEAEILLAQVENFLAKENQVIRENGMIEEKVEEEIEEEEIEKVDEEKQEGTPEQEIIFCSVSNYQTPTRNKVIINEIAWMGTTNSSNDEWFELKNISPNSIDLSGWQILDKDFQIKIVFNKEEQVSGGQTSGGGFFLLERTDDDSVLNVPADFIYTGALNDNSEALYLFDKDCNLQDKIEAISDWPAGNKNSKKTMERKSDLAWQTSRYVGGTPKAENSSGETQYNGGGGGAETPSPEQPKEEPKITLSYLEENPVNKEIEVELSVSGLEDASYDVKISIENASGTLSKIFNEKENDWKSSAYYLTNVFSGNSFKGNFRLKIIEDKQDFRGEADIVAKIRENGKSKYFEFADKINITEPEKQPLETKDYSPLDVVINEIAWMGTQADYNDEWLELYNNTPEEVDLNDWVINWGEGTSTRSINLTGNISAYGFYLLERTASTTISDIEEDQIYHGALGNEGEKLELVDLNSNLIDKVDCSSEWFAGNNETKHTMERIDPRVSGNNLENWADNNGVEINGSDAEDNSILGTPKVKNSVFSTLPPNPVSDFVIDEENSKYNTVVLTWSTTTDPDTAEQDISYVIYWAKEEIDEENASTTNPTAFSTSTVTTTLILSVLDYDSTYYFGIRAFDGGNYSSLSTTTPYNTPLPPINDLNAGTSAIRKTVDLFWTAPGAESYLIKYAEKEIVENPTSTEKISWEETTLVENSIVPKVAGEIEGFTIENLIPDKTYYFAIKSINKANAFSEISNSPKAKAIPGFQDNGDGTITDLYTGLMWVKDGNGRGANNGQPLSWQDAETFSDNLVLCQNGIFSTSTTSTICADKGGIKYDYWRLPGFKELAAIVDYQESSPLINQNFFPNTSRTNYWTLSYDDVPGIAYNYPSRSDIETVNFNSGTLEIISSRADLLYYVRPVRGPAIGTPNILPPANMDNSPAQYCQLGYTENEKTITDNCTNLMWVKGGTRALLSDRDNDPLSPKPGNISWKGAVAFCEGLELDGYNDWRVPNILELIIVANRNDHNILPTESGYTYYYLSSTGDESNFWGVWKEETIKTHYFSKDSGELYLQCLRNIN